MNDQIGNKVSKPLWTLVIANNNVALLDVVRGNQ